jgi:hypothetical protein
VRSSRAAPPAYWPWIDASLEVMVNLTQRQPQLVTWNRFFDLRNGARFATLLSVSNDDLGNKPEFDDRIDAKVRFNANLGNVFQLDEKWIFILD